MDRHVRGEELLADVLRQTRRSVKDVQRPTGTEKARTTERVEEVAIEAGAASSAASDALAAADQAAADAATAKTTADGRNRIYAQQIEPVTMPELPFVPGDLWYRTDTDGRISEVRVWNGTLWNPYQIVAGSILVPGSVGNVLIADGAMDAKTITGALIRTAASGQRLQFDSFGLRAFGALGDETASLDAAGGGLRLTGSMNLGTELDENGSYPNIAGRGASFFSRFGAGSAQLIRYAGIGQGSIFQSERDLSNREGSFAVVATPAQTTLTMDARDLDDPFPHRAASISRNIDKTMWVENPEGPIYIAATGSEDGTGKPADPSIWLVPQAFPVRGRIELRGDVRFDGDTDWVVVTQLGASGASPRVKYRRRDGLVEIIGRGTKGANSYGLFVLPVGMRPGGPIRFPDMSLAPNFGYFEISASGLVSSGNYAAATLDFNIRFEPVPN